MCAAVIEQALEDIGFTVHAPDGAEIFAQEERELRMALRKAIVAGVLLLAASALTIATVL